MKFNYDRQGLGLAELTRLAMTFPLLFSIVYWMAQHGLGKMALTLTRRVI